MMELPAKWEGVMSGDGLLDKTMFKEGSLWPSPAYAKQLDGLHSMIGHDIFLVRLNVSETHLSAVLENKPTTLLNIVPFPQPEPARRLYPHMLLLSDGRGINLGHVLRISVRQAFNPAASDVIYQQADLLNKLLYSPRSLSDASILSTTKQQLARLLGKVSRSRLK